MDNEIINISKILAIPKPTQKQKKIFEDKFYSTRSTNIIYERRKNFARRLLNHTQKTATLLTSSFPYLSIFPFLNMLLLKTKIQKIAKI